MKIRHGEKCPFRGAKADRKGGFIDDSLSTNCRQEILDHFRAELTHNEKWRLLHQQEGQLRAAQTRLEHCEKLQRWLEWLERA